MKPRRPSLCLLAACVYGVPAVLSISHAKATPQFARQTKLPCSACHEHIPLLNKYGQQFYANGFRLPKNHKMENTVPLWGSLGVQATTSRSLGSSVPISYALTEIASYGFIDGPQILYHAEYQPTEGQYNLYAIHPFNKNLAVSVGELGLLAQYDPRLDVSQTRPVYLSPQGTGALGNGKFGPFSPGSNAYGVRLLGSFSGQSALPYSDGWKISATVPFSAEAPCGLQPVFNSDPTGVFLEGFRRTGQNSYGVNMFDGRDGRRFYGAAGQEQLGKFFIEEGASYASFNGASTRMAGIGADWIPVWDKAFGVRVDDQDGFIELVPTISWWFGGKQGAFRLTAESTITHGVAPTTVFTAQLKF